MGSAASSVADAASNAPDAALRRTQGNPLAAGLIAFGAGLLASSLLPSTSMEQRAAAGLRDQAEPVIDTVKEEASRLKDELAPKAQQATQQVRAAATDAVRETTEEAKQAAGEVRERAQH